MGKYCVHLYYVNAYSILCRFRMCTNSNGIHSEDGSVSSANNNYNENVYAKCRCAPLTYTHSTHIWRSRAIFRRELSIWQTMKKNTYWEKEKQINKTYISCGVSVCVVCETEKVLHFHNNHAQRIAKCQ